MIMKFSRIAPLFATIALLSSPAFAWDCNYWSQSKNPKAECYKPPQTAGGKAKASSKSKSTAVAAASASVSANTVATASNDGVTTSFDSQEVRQTPPAFSGYVEPTTSCANARNGGASSPVAALSFGLSTKDKECDLRETARLFYEMGQHATAVRLLCLSQAAKRLPTCEYLENKEIASIYYPPGERERRKSFRGFPVDK